MVTNDAGKRCLQCCELARLFQRAAKMMARTYHRHSHAHHAQAHVFSIICRQGPISQRGLMKMLDVRSSSLSEILRKLEDRGLIERTRDEQDKRGYVIAVKEGIENPFPDHQVQKDLPAREEFFAGLQDKEKDELGVLLEKIVLSALEHGHKETDCKPADDGGKASPRHGRHKKAHHK